MKNFLDALIVAGLAVSIFFLVKGFTDNSEEPPTRWKVEASGEMLPVASEYDIGPGTTVMTREEVEVAANFLATRDITNSHMHNLYWRDEDGSYWRRTLPNGKAERVVFSNVMASPDTSPASR